MTVADIGILGPLRSRFENIEVTLSGAKLRSILALLALRTNGEVRRDELIEELDLIRTTGDAINALHAHVARLRRWLLRHGGKPDLLETVNSGYRLNLDRNSVDAHRFVDLVERALNLAPGTPSVVATILEDALLLWRGDALLDALDGPLVAAAADELHRWRAAARETLIDAWISLDHNQKVILNARKFISEDPLNESMRARHVVALRRMDRYAEAVEAYRSAERVLNTELGVGPGPELRAAAEGISDDTQRFESASVRYQLARTW
ncbi:BTAD domain-containing putative transcriptional regulator [Umezawaea sp. Da 62-37]|uniref:AfsR/SARP family transcriptional regulator n=1 Tax=Umezawaea sp. Da 62-37 TaxID=3075927 RepID=UPI0028F6E540|nr:BTAD domain-containing putative transcriptional regulator [Umezawaea sp. Da 62-37]WNV85268.1 BTAD domain-containing putative transcriptional regulator [Umezawaea sp. Da 62-37]